MIKQCGNTTLEESEFDGGQDCNRLTSCYVKKMTDA